MTDTIKKGAMTLAALAALGFGGAQLANATGGGPTPSPSQSAPADTTDPADTPDATEASEVPAPADAAKARAAALAKVPGSVTRITAENPVDDQAKEAADTPEPGDEADPAYESKIAYDVEVTKADGTTVDVHLDKTFAVLGTEAEGKESADDHAGGDHDGDHGEQGGENQD